MGSEGSASRSRRQTSRPSISGIMMSSTTSAGGRFARQRQGLGSRVGGRDFIALVGEAAAKEAGDRRVVVDDEEAESLVAAHTYSIERPARLVGPRRSPLSAVSPCPVSE